MSQRDNTTEMLNNILKLLEKENISVTAGNSRKRGLIPGLCVFAGTFLGGKAGMIAGGIAGAALEVYMNSNFVSVKEFIENQMNDEQKADLVELVQNIITSTAPRAFATVDANTKEDVIKAVLNFLQSQGCCSANVCRR